MMFLSFVFHESLASMKKPYSLPLRTSCYLLFFFFIITINNYSEEALSLGSIGPGGQIGPFPIDKMGLQAQ